MAEQIAAGVLPDPDGRGAQRCAQIRDAIFRVKDIAASVHAVLQALAGAPMLGIYACLCVFIIYFEIFISFEGFHSR